MKMNWRSKIINGDELEIKKHSKYEKARTIEQSVVVVRFSK
jgi:hypothetical protein